MAAKMHCEHSVLTDTVLCDLPRHVVHTTGDTTIETRQFVFLIRHPGSKGRLCPDCVERMREFVRETP